jgi:O-acetyl-ADP-ribose deacetylase
MEVPNLPFYLGTGGRGHYPTGYGRHRQRRQCQAGSGWGVDGAIHRAGGPAIKAECRQLGGCSTGEARLTTGGNLKARYVIDTVGPIYKDGVHREPERLASCYRESLKLASAKGLKTIAFSSISTGVYGYPLGDAARVALITVKDYLTRHPEIAPVPCNITFNV